jgi:hypothetical protein
MFPSNAFAAPPAQQIHEVLQRSAHGFSFATQQTERRHLRV